MGPGVLGGSERGREFWVCWSVACSVGVVMARLASGWLTSDGEGGEWGCLGVPAVWGPTGSSPGVPRGVTWWGLKGVGGLIEGGGGGRTYDRLRSIYLQLSFEDPFATKRFVTWRIILNIKAIGVLVRDLIPCSFFIICSAFSSYDWLMKDNGNKDLREGEAARFNIDALRAIMKNSKDALSAAKISTNPNYVGENIASTGVGKGDHVKGFLNPNTESIYVRVSSSIDLKQGATFGIGTVVGDTNLEPQSPLVSPTAPLPLHQSNVDVAATFGVSLSTVGDLKVLIRDIDPGKYEELLSGMTNDKRKVVIDALGAMCDLIKAESASRPGLEFDGTRNETSVSVTIHTSSPEEEWVNVDACGLNNSKKHACGIIDIICNRWDTLLNMQKSAPLLIDNLSGEGVALMTLMFMSWGPSIQVTFLCGEAGTCRSRISFGSRGLIKVNSDGSSVELLLLIFGQVHALPKKVKKRKGKSKSNNGGSVKQTIRYELKVTTSAPKKGTTNEGNASISSSMLKTTGASSKKDNISTSNTFSALNDDEEDEDKAVENVYDESDNLFPNTKTGGNSSFTVAYG
ncbi:hypothetical protein Tco_1313953 [Tanacetum coccineum]